MRPLRILNVAEKNDAAKELSRIMSRGQSVRVGRTGHANHRGGGGGSVTSYNYASLWSELKNFLRPSFGQLSCPYQNFVQ